MNETRSFRVPPGVLCLLALLPALVACISPDVPGEPREGVVVEKVAPASAAESAGIRPGDLLLTWSRGEGNGGPIRSPFDLGRLKIEQAPRGELTLRGLREGQGREWRLPADSWGIKARPILPAALLALYRQGQDRIAGGDVEAGARHLRSALEAAERLKDPLRASWLEKRLAVALANAGRWPEAEAAWERAVRRLEGSHAEAAAQLLRDEDWHEVLQRLNLRDRSDACYRRSLALEPAESLAAAWDLSVLGVRALRKGDLAAAEALCLKAHAIGEKLIPGTLDFARSLTNLGNLAMARGDLSTAEERFRKVLNLLERLKPDGAEFATALAQLGLVDMSRGNLAIAEERFWRALAVQEGLAPESQAVVRVLNYLGVLAEKRGDPAAAEEYHRRALGIGEKLARGSDDPGSSVYLLYNLAAIEKRKGNLAQAEEHLARILKIQDSTWPGQFDITETCFQRALIALERGDLALAEEMHGRALAILEKQSPGGIRASDNLEGLGTVALQRGDLKKAEELFRRSLAILEKIAPGSTRMGVSLNHLGQVYRRTGRRELAAEQLCRATEAFDLQRKKLGGTTEEKLAFGGTMTEPYRDCLAALADTGRPEEAFLALERGRARSFLDLLAERDLNWTAALPPELEGDRKQADADYDRTQAALGRLSPERDQAEVDRLLVQLRELRARQEEIAAKIRGAAPHAAALQDPQPLDLAGARAALDPGTVLLAWSVGQERSFLFVVQPAGTPGQGLEVFPIALGDAALRKEVESFRLLLKRPGSGRAAVEGQARLLYDLLVRPGEERISRAQRVLLSPDGPLHTLPFAALMNGDRYLVEWKPIHFVLSATVYAELARSRPAHRRPGEERLVVFGDPVYPTQASSLPADLEVREAVRIGLTLKPLPYTRKEVESVAALYPGAQVFLGPDATEERAKSIEPGSRLVHFACHGLLDERFPLNSALALTIPEHAAAGQDNGLLQAWEIFESVRLDADLVTLSACDTALGREMGGEGLVGLTRAFQYAGARSVLASLWGISDVSTAAFMKVFYGYLRGGQTKDEALRAAQIDRIRGKSGSSHPFYWAAFELTGDWR